MSNDGIKWIPLARIEKYSPEVVEELTHVLGYEPKSQDFTRLGADPYSVEEYPGNILVTNGLGNLTNLFTGGGGSVVSTARGFLAVGDSSTGELAANSDLAAATNKYYNVLDSVTRVTTTVTNDAVQVQSTYGTSAANFAWAEWVLGSSTSGTITNATTLAGIATGAFIINRKTAVMGTKASGASWVFTAKITFS